MCFLICINVALNLLSRNNVLFSMQCHTVTILWKIYIAEQKDFPRDWCYLVGIRSLWVLKLKPFTKTIEPLYEIFYHLLSTLYPGYCTKLLLLKINPRKLSLKEWKFLENVIFKPISTALCEISLVNDYYILWAWLLLKKRKEKLKVQPCLWCSLTQY